MLSEAKHLASEGDSPPNSIQKPQNTRHPPHLHALKTANPPPIAQRLPLGTAPADSTILSMKEFLQKLIRADSTPDKGEFEAANVIADYFEANAIEAEVDCWSGNRANVTAWLKSTGEKPPLIFACHLDVVGPGEEKWEHPPFSGLEIGKTIYGRGSTDMKGGTVAAARALADIHASQTPLKGDIIFTATAGEETDSSGAERFVQQYPGPAPAGVVIPEPTDFDIVAAHRGMFWLEITTLGKAAHSSTPHLGVNALSAMKKVLDALEKYRIPFEPSPLLGDCSVSINRIHAGEAMNVVPDKCTLGIDIRTVPGQDHDAIEKDIVDLCRKVKEEDPQFSASVEVLRSVGSLQTDPDNDFVTRLCKAVRQPATKAVGFTTDGPHFSKLGGPVLVFGPGKSHRCHKPNECIETADLQKALDLYKDIIAEFLT